MNLEALFNAVIVKPIEIEEKKYGSIVVPDMGKDKNEKGEVVSVGPGQHTISGDFISTVSKIGDIVVLPTQGFTKLEYDGDEYYVGPENQILAKLKKEVNVGDILAETKVTKEEEEYINDIKIKENE
jgi:chaperonin GroES